MPDSNGKINFKFNFNIPGAAMKTISMLEFRRNADQVIAQVQRGERLVLTYRGKPVARLEPIVDRAVSAEDPIYTIYQLADSRGESLTNEEIDRIVYGE